MKHKELGYTLQKLSREPKKEMTAEAICKRFISKFEFEITNRKAAYYYNLYMWRIAFLFRSSMTNGHKHELEMQNKCWI